MKNATQENKSLKNLNTFGIEAIANQYIQVEDEQVLKDLFSAGAFENEFFILGGGSNVLFTKDYPGLIVHVANKGIQHFIEGNNVFVTAAGGEVWNDLVCRLLLEKKKVRMNVTHIRRLFCGSSMQSIRV